MTGILCEVFAANGAEVGVACKLMCEWMREVLLSINQFSCSPAIPHLQICQGMKENKAMACRCWACRLMCLETGDESRNGHAQAKFHWAETYRGILVELVGEPLIFL
jgi:hypothetical protein